MRMFQIVVGGGILDSFSQIGGAVFPWPESGAMVRISKSMNRDSGYDFNCKVFFIVDSK